jgi:hypothetical protein
MVNHLKPPPTNDLFPNNGNRKEERRARAEPFKYPCRLSLFRHYDVAEFGGV